MDEAPIIHIIDDDPDVRNALGLLLQNKGRPFRLYASAQAFLDSVDLHRAGCVITDVRMPDMSGIELLRHMTAAQSILPVIVMTAYADVPLAIQVMKQGAADLLEKPFTHETLLAAIDNALALAGSKEKHFDMVQEVQRKLSLLTSREREVLNGLLQGRPNKIIAHQLGINIRTVETHRATVMQKMQAESLAELVRMCLTASGDEPRSETPPATSVDGKS